MKNPRRLLVLGAAALFALWADGGIGPLQLRSAAHAIIGRPLTPVSYAGAARRTVRRTGRAYASVAATTAVTATAVAATQAAAGAATAAAAGASGVPIGTIVAALPPGCVSAPIRGVNYFDCGGVFYRPAFQSNNLVYVVSQP
jgi:IMP dehydrogenase/GMP reductase